MEYSGVMLRGVEAAELRAIRERMGLLQVDLAKALDVTQGALSRWETGSRPIPGPVAKLVVLLAAQQTTSTKPERRKR
jgi:DNA-binding transcriptional regulator YiaG